MARIPDLDNQTSAATDWVIEIDEPEKAISESQKIRVRDLKEVMDSRSILWTTLTLVNGWTGTSKYRIVTADGSEYLELFFDLTDGSATNSVFANIATAGDRTDYDYDVVLSSSGAKFVCNNTGDLQIIGYAGTGTSYGYAARILKLTP